MNIRNFVEVVLSLGILSDLKWVDAVMLKFPAIYWLHFVRLCY